MNEIRNKKEFRVETENKIKVRNELYNFYEETFLPILNKFDGKVYSKRFINAILASDGIDKRIFVSGLEKTMYGKYNDYIRLNMYYESGNYTKYASIFVKLILTKDERIDAKASLEDKVGQKWVESFNDDTESYRDAITNYDEYKKVADNLTSLIREYNALPHAFRENMDKNLCPFIY